MPSVITMHSGISASIASRTAVFVPVSGTKTTDTSAPVAAIVSATVPKTGSSVPFSSAVRKIATSCSLHGGGGGQLGRAPRRAVHRVHLLHHRQVRLFEDGPAFGR